jgi:dihydropteroate synthase
MGILNVTPDSFSDGGCFDSVEVAVKHAFRMVDEGAKIIDIGGESTRPGAHEITEQEEVDRVLPLIEALIDKLPVPISIDTSKPNVMRTAISAGVGMVNDTRALRIPGALEVVKPANVPVCLMHMQNSPHSMQNNPHYANVVGEVKAFLRERVQHCVDAGISRDRLLVDPGFGFGKTIAHNLTLLANLRCLKSLRLPLLVGLSRKSMIGTLLDRPVGERLYGSLSAAVIAASKGASIIRTHDVRPTVEAITLLSETMRYSTDREI